MKGYLLDVNILVALFWRGHQHHDKAKDWFFPRAAKRWRTCPITQAGFVRLLGNPKAVQGGPSPEDARELLRQNIQQPGHEFWRADLPFEKAASLAGIRLRGHRQVTDAYLLGLAIHHGGKLATMDEGLAASNSRAVELIR